MSILTKEQAAEAAYAGLGFFTAVTPQEYVSLGQTHAEQVLSPVNATLVSGQNLVNDCADTIGKLRIAQDTIELLMDGADGFRTATINDFVALKAMLDEGQGSMTFSDGIDSVFHLFLSRGNELYLSVNGDFPVHIMNLPDTNVDPSAFEVPELNANALDSLDMLYSRVLPIYQKAQEANSMIWEYATLAMTDPALILERTPVLTMLDDPDLQRVVTLARTAYNDPASLINGYINMIAEDCVIPLHDYDVNKLSPLLDSDGSPRVRIFTLTTMFKAVGNMLGFVAQVASSVLAFAGHIIPAIAVGALGAVAKLAWSLIKTTQPKVDPEATGKRFDSTFGYYSVVFDKDNPPPAGLKWVFTVPEGVHRVDLGSFVLLTQINHYSLLVDSEGRVSQYKATALGIQLLPLCTRRTTTFLAYSKSNQTSLTQSVTTFLKYDDENRYWGLPYDADVAGDADNYPIMAALKCDTEWDNELGAAYIHDPTPCINVGLEVSRTYVSPKTTGDVVKQFNGSLLHLIGFLLFSLGLFGFSQSAGDDVPYNAKTEAFLARLFNVRFDNGARLYPDMLSNMFDSFSYNEVEQYLEDDTIPLECKMLAFGAILRLFGAIISNPLSTGTQWTLILNVLGPFMRYCLSAPLPSGMSDPETYGNTLLLQMLSVLSRAAPLDDQHDYSYITAEQSVSNFVTATIGLPISDLKVPLLSPPSNDAYTLISVSLLGATAIAATAAVGVYAYRKLTARRISKARQYDEAAAAAEALVVSKGSKASLKEVYQARRLRRRANRTHQYMAYTANSSGAAGTGDAGSFISETVPATIATLMGVDDVGSWQGLALASISDKADQVDQVTNTVERDLSAIYRAVVSPAERGSSDDDNNLESNT